MISSPFHFNMRRYAAEEADAADARASEQGQQTEADAMEAARAIRQGRNTRSLSGSTLQAHTCCGMLWVASSSV